MVLLLFVIQKESLLVVRGSCDEQRFLLNDKKRLATKFTKVPYFFDEQI
jgi:hypothetical protein